MQQDQIAESPRSIARLEGCLSSGFGPSTSEHAMRRPIFIASAIVFITVNLINAANDLILKQPRTQFDADAEGTAFTFASVAGASAAAAAALLLSTVARRLRYVWIAVAVTLVFLALDDLFVWHEKIGDGWDPVILPNKPGIWFPLYLPLLILVFSVIWVNTRGLTRLTLPRIGLGLLVLAVVAEASVAIIPGMDGDQHRAGYTIEVGIEESFELIGWWFIAAGLTAIWRDERRRRSRPIDAASPGEGQDVSPALIVIPATEIESEGTPHTAAH